MTDFLDQLEDELRVAAERRGQPRRRRPTGPLKALAAAALVAVLVVGAARLATREDTERAASPTPAPTPTPAAPGHSNVVYATAGDPALLGLLSARVRGFVWTELPAEPSTADPSLGTVVLYRPDGEELARSLAFRPKIDAVRPLTEADEERIHVDVSDADVVVVYGPGEDARLLSDSRVCAPAGGELKLCVDRSDEQRYSALVLGDRALSVAPVDERGWWSWAALAPEGRTILAQWSGDCGPVFAIDAAGGDPRKLGAGDAVGWTTAGDPLLYVPPRCGEPGTYLMPAGGERERVTADRLEPSHRPREVG